MTAVQQGRLGSTTEPLLLLVSLLQLPSEWVTHNTVNFQPPAACTYALASYPTAKHVGPREKQVGGQAVWTTRLRAQGLVPLVHQRSAAWQLLPEHLRAARLALQTVVLYRGQACH